jgi:hypothetical protein
MLWASGCFGVSAIANIELPMIRTHASTYGTCLYI